MQYVGPLHAITVILNRDVSHKINDVQTLRTRPLLESCKLIFDVCIHCVGKVIYRYTMCKLTLMAFDLTSAGLLYPWPERLHKAGKRLSIKQGRQTGESWGGLNPPEFWIGG